MTLDVFELVDALHVYLAEPDKYKLWFTSAKLQATILQTLMLNKLISIFRRTNH